MNGCTPAIATMRVGGVEFGLGQVGMAVEAPDGVAGAHAPAQAFLLDLRVEVAEAELRQAVLRRELADDAHVAGRRGCSCRCRPAEPMIIGTPSRRDASSIASRSCVCQASGLVEVSEPSGIGPTSSLPESAAM